ncbi:MAG: 30S ribosomal protein S9 [Candidatus Margulisbacteria bacterium]|nr:30S ribosomal protein S9 [Candidatus Margulisiibacteriota bacterium]MBU1022076.1 30S ribosomal protein S9 [Candidatus Margulisiibacteriota bacterium]MBU1729671.1 30S ribosomal protein S9 [Candidatus Margulisiibacteriota bacterium]MBU1767992.1 30S ribosomal protein S9 [Candidatus Omnitrophota bacterium]MBU1954991.1 30S ribosomal protein S9 [Candidatus Margulisiibacteriota bacterium]
MAEEKIKKTKKAVAKKPRATKKKKVEAPKKEVVQAKEEAKVEKQAAPIVEAQAKVEVPQAAKPAEIPAAPKVKTHKKVVRPATVAYWGTGRRKTAVARVRLVPGNGNFKINGRGLLQYATGRVLLEYQAKRPLIITKNLTAYDVIAKIHGGGTVSQIGALSLGIARALLEINPNYRKALKIEGLLTRDPREKERKKFGHKKARKSFQFSKR